MRIIIWNAFWRLVTSVVIRVTRPAVLNLSMFENENCWTRPFEGIKMELLEGEAEIMPGVRVFETPGHSIGHQSVEIDTAAGRYICCGDAIFIMDNTKPIEDFFPPVTGG